MTWYALLRVIHSYWRWAVLVSAVVVVVRAIVGVAGTREWTATDDRASRLFIAALDIQFLLGVILYFGFSPFWSALYHSFSETMKDQGSRFFGIEHQTAMLVATMVAHAGNDRAKRKRAGGARHRTLLLTLMIFFAVVFWAIPWP